MNRLYFVTNCTQLESSNLDVHLKTLPLFLQQKAMKFMKWQDRQAFIFGRMLIRQVLLDFGSRASLGSLKYNSFNRPYIDGPLDFNLSHTEGLIVCVASNKTKVGIDVELIKDINMDDYIQQFKEQEWESIQRGKTDKEKQLNFYRLWTQKEAFLKAFGEGLNTELNRVEINGDVAIINGNKFHLQRSLIDERFIIHIASWERLKTLEIIKITI